MKIHLAFEYNDINRKYHKELWHEGVNALGWQLTSIDQASVVVLWGIVPELDIAKSLGIPVLVCDFPYWNRGWKIRNGNEYYKVSLNGQHPTDYVMQETHTDERYNATRGPTIFQWRSDGSYILIAGMGKKAALQFGYQPGEWEARTAETIRKHTNTPIVYRPKPRQAQVNTIPDARLDTGQIPILQVIKGAKSVVCHHGNPTIDALSIGVPIFMNGKIGAASHLACHDFTKIEKPFFPENRHQFFYNLSHWQWSCDEIRSGRVLLEYVKRGLI